MLAAVALSMAVSCFSAHAIQREYVCPDATVSVKAQQLADFVTICNGAKDALSFFAGLRLTPTHPLVVEIVPELPDVVGETGVGCYLEDKQRILVLTFEAFQKHKKWFRVPVGRSMYRSVVTHEVAHAVADCNFKVPHPTIQAKEYVAYAAMFAMMHPELRKRIFFENPGHGFDNELKMNETIYLCDPMRFGIEAYRHYLKDGHGNTFILSVIAGNALAAW